MASARRATRTPADSIDRDLDLDLPGPGAPAAVETVPAEATARRGGKPAGAIIDEERRTGRGVRVRAGSVPAAGRAAMRTDRPTGDYLTTAPNRAGDSSATGRGRPEGRTAMIASPSRAVARAGRHSTARIGRRSIVRTDRRSTEPEGLDTPAPDPLALARRSPPLARLTPVRVRHTKHLDKGPVRGRPGTARPAGRPTRPSSAIAARRRRRTASSIKAKSW